MWLPSSKAEQNLDLETSLWKGPRIHHQSKRRHVTEESSLPLNSANPKCYMDNIEEETLWFH